MNNIIKILLFILLPIVPLFSEENDLLSGYDDLIKNTQKIENQQVTAKIDRSTSSVVMKDKYEWLVFVFMNGVNDLGVLNFSKNDINEMEMVGSTDKVAVVVESNKIDRDSNKFASFSDGAVTYFVTKDNSNSKDIVSKVIAQTPDGDMGSYKHFAISAQKAIKRFKPDKLLVIIWNHGNGYFGISYDDVSGNSISVPQLKSALKSISKTYGKKVDIFAMDACLMQMAEVVGELKDEAKYIVASEEMIPGAGYPYDDILNLMNKTSDIKSVARGMVDVYDSAYSSSKMTAFGRYNDKSTTLSAVDASKYDEFISAFNRWIEKAINSDDFKTITDKSVTENAFFFLNGEQRETIDMGGSMNTQTENIMTRTTDLVDYLKNARAKMKDTELISLTDNLINVITKKLVISQKGGDYQNSTGLSYKDRTYGLAIYLPSLRYDSSRYEALNFSKVSLWDEFVKKMLGGKINSSISSSASNGEDGGIVDDEASEDGSSSLPVNSTTTAKKSSISPKGILSAFSAGSNTTATSLKPANKAMASLNASGSSAIPSASNGVVKISDNIVAKPSNVFSTTYTTSKTLKPDISKLEASKSTGVEKKSGSGLSTNTDNKESKSSSSSDSFITKSKNAIKSFASSAIEKSKDLYEKVFPDKEKINAYKNRLDEFDVEISTKLNVVYADKLVKDLNLQKELLKIDKARTNKLISYSNELIELDRIVSRNYDPKELNSLSKTLETRLDKSRLICDLRICIPPEKLVEWMDAQGKQSVNISNIEIAIRKWERVFTDGLNVESVSWSQAGTLRFSTTSWSNMSIKERNAVLGKFIESELQNGTTSSALIAMSDSRMSQVGRYNELSIAVDNVSQKMLDMNILNSEELKAIKSKPLDEQMYILSNFFDRGGLKNDKDVSSYVNMINANRSSFTSEVIDANKRAAVSSYISASAKTELSKTSTGRNLYNQLYTDKKPEISVEYINGVESSNDGNKITIDAKIVEQFLRVNGYAADDLIKNSVAKKELLTYISPLVVREMADISISKSMGDTYSPDVREKYSAGLLYQAKYTEERKDEAFKTIFDKFSGMSDYADKVMTLRRNYEQSDNTDDFIETSGMRYYSNMPSSSSAKSEILLAVQKELERRNTLSSKEKKNIDKYSVFSGKDVYKLSPYDITNHIKDIKTDELIALEKNLTSDDNFDSKLSSVIKGIS